MLQHAVVVVGSANVDLVVRVPRLPAPGETLLGESAGRFSGGKGLNQAIGAARSGAAVRWAGALGDDADAALLRDTADDAGVRMTAQTVSAPTGVAHIFALPGGENSIVVAAGANAQVPPDAAAAAVAGASVVLAQLEIPVAAVAAALAAADAGTVRILNAAPVHPDTASLLDRVDVLIVNETECDQLGGTPALTADGNRTVVVTKGGAGVDVYQPGVAPVHVAAFPIDPVDTTGAGDAFCGAFAAAVAAGADYPTAARRGAAAGAIVAQHAGATTTALSASAIDLLVAGR